jgi:hypothetical protein
MKIHKLCCSSKLLRLWGCIRILNASTIGEIDTAFAILARERLDALLVAGDAFLIRRRVQLATLTARQDSSGLRGT